MDKRFKDVKVDVTLNDSGFDTPSEIQIDDEGEIPYCRMVFPGGTRSRYKILKRDKIKVYIGLDDVSDYPVFVGFPVEESGIIEARMEFAGGLYRATKDFRRVTDYDNFDGLEIGQAIRKVWQSTLGLATFSPYIETTNPLTTVPINTRYNRGISKYELFKEFRDLAVDPSDPLNFQGYVLFVHGNGFHFRKIPNPNTANPWVEIAYGDSLLEIDQDALSGFAINRATVTGKNDAFGEYQNLHRINIDGLHEADPVSDNTITNDGEATDSARFKVFREMIKEVPLVVNSPLLLEGIPNFSIFEISGAPYGLSGNYLLKSKSISISEGTFEVSGKISTPVDVIGQVLTNLVGLDRDLPVKSEAAQPTAIA